MLSNRRRFPYGYHVRTAHQDLPVVERITRSPNPSPRRLREYDERVRIARRWILSTINDFFKGSLYAVSEGDAIDVLSKKVRPNNTRLGRGKERRKVLTAAFRGLIRDRRIVRAEDRGIYGTVAA